jgi:hypothetical protein
VHQFSILLILFSAFQVGAVSMFDILRRGGAGGIGPSAFVYSGLAWCFVNVFWAVGFYALNPVFHGGYHGVDALLGGFDTPFSLGFYAPRVPRLAMVAYAAMNAVGFGALWNRRKAPVAALAIAVPVAFVNAYALVYGSIVLSL